jgi:hypothetical protein
MIHKINKVFWIYKINIKQNNFTQDSFFQLDNKHDNAFTQSFKFFFSNNETSSQINLIIS